MKTLFSLLCILLFIVSCGSSKAVETTSAEPAPHEHAHVATANEDGEPTEVPETAPEDILANDGTRKVGDVTKCPVSGDVFTVTATTPVFEHEGGTYYLCCKGCVKDFAAAPAKYLAGDAEMMHHGHHGDSKSDSHEHEGHKH